MSMTMARLIPSIPGKLKTPGFIILALIHHAVFRRNIVSIRENFGEARVRQKRGECVARQMGKSAYCVRGTRERSRSRASVALRCSCPGFSYPHGLSKEFPGQRQKD